ncbi:TBC1 domain family member 13-like [Hylaeus volcanicus]|uniref:TBC1 domain family member 13-like n=1 Tax=Hylaeus volcanicus TaxID=313075 RepID=UPI0023B7B521|nr:TBC1 domain family member 13-like [Hylaeus volcanicus]
MMAEDLPSTHPFYPIICYSKTVCKEEQIRLKESINVLLYEDLDHIKKHCFEGLLHEPPALRAIYWKILLGYLPPANYESWSHILKNKRNTYLSYVELCQKETNVMDFNMLTKKGNSCQEEIQRECEDIPTSSGQQLTGVMSTDSYLFDQINKDVFRTQCLRALLNNAPPNFSNKTLENKTIPLSICKKVNILCPESFSDQFARILYTYAKSNKTLKYVQGMNEMLAVIFYVIFQDNNNLQYSEQIRNPLQQKEADAFFCFSQLLKLNNHGYCFCPCYDLHPLGIIGRVQRFSSMLKIHEPQIYDHFQNLKLSTQFFALRWILVLFSQDFPLLVVLRLWDSFISEGDAYHESQHELCYFIALSIVSQLKRQLLICDFSSAIQLLQHIPVLIPEVLVSHAIGLRCDFETKTDGIVYKMM